MMALSVCSIFHERSTGGLPTSINEGTSRKGALRVLKRRRMVRGLTKVIEKGNAGSASYSVPGNSVGLPLANVTSILLKERVVVRRYLSHWSVPCPVAGLKSVTLLPMK